MVATTPYTKDQLVDAWACVTIAQDQRWFFIKALHSVNTEAGDPIYHLWVNTSDEGDSHLTVRHSEITSLRH